MSDRWSWRRRRQRLYTLLSLPQSQTESDVLRDDAFTERLNEVLQGEHDKAIDGLLFSNKDVVSLGRLANGQFGAVDLVRCSLDNRVYARKTLTKCYAFRSREQCFVQNERNLLLAARTSRTPWVPHLICAYQSPLDLCLLMQYAEGGTLWDLLEYSEGRIEETDAKWWISQAVAAICWCHEQGYVHRDIKPHNFSITSSAHLQILDFGSSAPLLPPSSDGVQLVSPDLCFVPCGTCDYVSPEILQRYEDALFAAGVGDDGDVRDSLSHGYGRETDWWSFGAMIYEMVYGVAPFFSEDVAQTYAKITHYKKNLHFDDEVRISTGLKALICALLTDCSRRLGRHAVDEVQHHPYFKGVNWSTLHTQPRPTKLVLPQFSYVEKPPETPPLPDDSWDMSYKELLAGNADVTERSPPSEPPTSPMTNPFAAFNWGPAADAFDDVLPLDTKATKSSTGTPRMVKTKSGTPIRPRHAASSGNSFQTPVRSGQTPRVGSGSVRRERLMSDRQAFRQMLNLVGESAHKKVLESGKKPALSAEERRTFYSTRTMSALNMSSHSVDDGPPSPSPRPGSSASRAASRLENYVDQTRPSAAASRVENPVEVTTTSPDEWEVMERRHAAIMYNIKLAQRKLEQLKVSAQ